MRGESMMIGLLVRVQSSGATECAAEMSRDMLENRDFVREEAVCCSPEAKKSLYAADIV